MPINAPCIIALGPKLARRHAAHIPERLQLVLVRLVIVVVRARVVRAIVAQEVHVAHFQLLDPLDFVRVVLDDGVDALAEAIAGDLRG